MNDHEYDDVTIGIALSSSPLFIQEREDDASRRQAYHSQDEGGQEDGVPKAGLQQAAADSRGSRTCVCVNTVSWEVAYAGREG